MSLVKYLKSQLFSHFISYLRSHVIWLLEEWGRGSLSSTPDVKMGGMYKRTMELKFENYHLSNNVV